MLLDKILNDKVDCSDILQMVLFKTPSSTRPNDLFVRQHHRTNYAANSTMVRLRDTETVLPMLWTFSRTVKQHSRRRLQIIKIAGNRAAVTELKCVVVVIVCVSPMPTIQSKERHNELHHRTNDTDIGPWRLSSAIFGQPILIKTANLNIVYLMRKWDYHFTYSQLLWISSDEHDSSISLKQRQIPDATIRGK
ncbi:hypothetical protein J6590_054317 [Homalodisca vitripennis]|nr:hypothetical protein J6590_054317 [Homalodisca vitripennis]